MTTHTFSVELTYVQCFSIEASDAKDAILRILNDDEIPLPPHSSARVTGVEQLD